MKRRLYLSIDSKLFEKLQVAADKRDVSKSEVVTDALNVELKVTSLRVDIQKSERRYLAASDILERKKAEQKTTKSELKEAEQKNIALQDQIALFKQKFEEAVANLQYAEAKLTAYQRQNWFQRLFNRPLAILPYDQVEARKGDPPTSYPDTPVIIQHDAIMRLGYTTENIDQIMKDVRTALETMLKPAENE